MKILIAEDDQVTSDLLSDLLTAMLSVNQYAVDLATDGELALEFIKQWKYDLILLDLNLPKRDGIQLCREIRSQGNEVPILMLSAHNTEEDVIAGLEAGADDYVIKPCNINQLLARIRSLLQRRETFSHSILTWGALSLDPMDCRVMYHQQEVVLRVKEYMLLELLMRYPQRIFSRSAILDHLWSADRFPTESAVTHLIQDLRHALATAGISPDLIETVYGVGYRLKAESGGRSPVQDLNRIDTQKNTPQSHPSVLDPLLIEQLRERHEEITQQRMSQLEKTAELLLAGQLQEEHQQIAKQEAHRLAGTLGMYGHSKASEIARSLDRLLAEDITTTQDKIMQFMKWFHELRQELNPSSAPVVLSTQTGLPPLILVISEDDCWAEALQQEAHNWNLRVEAIPDVSPAQRKLILEAPVAIALELGGVDSDNDKFANLREIKQHYPGVPVFTLAVQDNLADRVVASRFGSERYLTKPVTPAQLLEAIAQHLPLSQPASQATVLIVDDDPAIHPLLAQMLKPWGLEAISLTEPEKFWEVLTQTNPDLVLLDIEMPTFNGLELCRVVRQESQYSDLPVLVITARTEPGCIQQVFDAGADDLLRKPIVDAELVTRVLHRLERSRLRKQIALLHRQQTQQLYHQATVDALTQVANRRAFDEFLQKAWHQLQAEHSPISLILCDVDHFKRYNDSYGHPEGDVCLQKVARTLQYCVRLGVDQVARYGGEEFAIVLPNTSLSEAINVVERIQTAIARLKIPQSTSANSPYVSLSLGVTGTIPSSEKSIAKLIAMADRALYAAKEQGRNTYCLCPL